MSWVTMFPQCTNTLLIKDVGMVPYAYYKRTGDEASIVCYLGKKSFPFLKKEVDCLRIIIDKKSMELDSFRK